MRSGAATVLAAIGRSRLWRVTAVLAALLLCALAFVCGQGSLTVIARQPAAGRLGVTASPAWERWCTRGHPREDRKRLAFCARAEGRVLSSTTGPGPGEEHLAVLGDFHIVLIRLPDGTPMPARGTKIVAIGPLFRARDGQREVQAFLFQRI
jgi:hypothetical protein